MSFPITILPAGRAKFINPANTGTAAATIGAIGLSATAITPDLSATSLPGEFKRVNTVGGQMVADDIIHVSMTDASADDYSARSLAIYLADGTLLALYGQAAPILTKVAASEGLLALDIQLKDDTASQISFGPTDWVNPPASETVWGVIKLATLALAKAGADALSALTPAAAKAAVLDWIGFTPVQQGGGAGQNPNKVYLGWGVNGRLKVQVDVTDQGNLVTDDVAAKAWVDFNGWGMRRNGLDLYGPDNDGAGSPVDAGLLAGQLPSWYTDIVARLQYTPANRAGDTFTGPIRRDYGYYVDLSGGVNPLLNFDDQDYMFFDRANNVLKVVIGNAVRMVMPFHGNLDLYSESGGIYINGQMIWHTGNDGAGSGLDAGLFCGRLISWFAGIDSPSFTGTPRAPTPAQGNSDTLLATTAFVGRAQATNSGVVQFVGSGDLSAADVGKTVILGGTGGTLTLPAGANLLTNGFFNIFAQGGSWTVQTSNGDVISIGTSTNGTAVTSFGMSGSDFCGIEWHGGGSWLVSSGTPMLAMGGGVFGTKCPMPNTSGGIGYVQNIAIYTNLVYLPAGGTYFYWFSNYGESYTGIGYGTQTIYSGPLNNCFGFCWRIA